MIPGVDCQSAFNLCVTAVRVQFELRRFADTHRLARIYMVLRGLYGLWPEIWVERLRCWVGRTSTGLICRPFQKASHTISTKYDLQHCQNEGRGGSSHPRLQKYFPSQPSYIGDFAKRRKIERL